MTTAPVRTPRSTLPTADELTAAGLRLDLDGAVATLTLDRPEVRNAQTPSMWRTMARVGAGMPDEVRVVLVRGSGGSFSAGLDRRMLVPAEPGAGDGTETVAALLAMDDEGVLSTIGDYQDGFTWLRDPRFVSVAVVRGHAVGAGFQLALSCDLRLAADDAQFCMKEAALGLVPDLAGTKPLVDAVGYARALEICATARVVPAAEAERLGLAQVVPAAELDAAVDALVAALTAPMAGAVRGVKEILLGAEGRSIEQQCLVERTVQVGRFRELAAMMG